MRDLFTQLYGDRHYYKYRDEEEEPQDFDALVDEIVRSIMLGLDEIIEWGE